MAYSSLDATNFAKQSSVEAAVSQATTLLPLNQAAAAGVGVISDSGNLASYDENGVPDNGGPLPGGYDEDGNPKPPGQFDENGDPKPAGGFDQYGVPTEHGGYAADGTPQPAGGHDEQGNPSPAGIYNEYGFPAGISYWKAGMAVGSAPIKP